MPRLPTPPFLRTGSDLVTAEIMNIGQRIDRSYGELSPQEQRAADFILDHLSDLAVYSGTELAQRSGVSKATVSRLFRRLGFENAQEVREHARSLRSSGVPVGGIAPAHPLICRRIWCARSRTCAAASTLSGRSGSSRPRRCSCAVGR